MFSAVRAFIKQPLCSVEKIHKSENDCLVEKKKRKRTKKIKFSEEDYTSLKALLHLGMWFTLTRDIVSQYFHNRAFSNSEMLIIR